MAAARKMDELLVSWLGSDSVYESILELIETYRNVQDKDNMMIAAAAAAAQNNNNNNNNIAVEDDNASSSSPREVIIPPFYPKTRKRRSAPHPHECWVYRHSSSSSPHPHHPSESSENDYSGTTASVVVIPSNSNNNNVGGGDSTSSNTSTTTTPNTGVREHVQAIFQEIGQDPPLTSPSSVQSSDNENTTTINQENNNNNNTGQDMMTDPCASSFLRRKYIPVESFLRITKDVCRFPSFFNVPLYQRILLLWNNHQAQATPMEVVTYDMLEWYWSLEMEPYDGSDRFFRLVKQPDNDYIARDDFLPFIHALLQEHPGLEFLSSHAEFQEKYALTVITRIFYSVNKCHSGKITSRQIRRSDLLDAFYQVDEEEDINKVTRYLSYEHFYVLYCRFWELDHDRDYRITRDDLLKYGDHSLSHMIVDRIFDAAPRPFEQENPNREFITYESFIYFMLSEEDKSNEVSVRYWFSCVDVDGDGKLNNMEMRSFYAVQLHRMQVMGQEIVPFEDMLCQMMDMIKPANKDFFVVSDFLQPECRHVSGALFDALFNLNKYLMFEQRDPFVERQKREDEFECDWDRFACIDYNRLAMEEEAREEEAMEIDWVTVDEDEDGASGNNNNSPGNGGFGEGGGQQQQGGGGGGGGHHNQGGGGGHGGGGNNEAPF